MNSWFKKIRHFIKEKKVIPKLASILLAVGFWAYISSIETGTLRFRVPVTYVNLDQGLTVSKISSKTVMVEIRGAREELKNASIKNMKLFIDLAGAEPGVYTTYRVQQQKGEVPEGFDIEYDPVEVKVLLDKKAYKNVRVIPRFSGNVPRGFIMGRLKAMPEYVRVGGAADVIKKITAVYTESISVSGRNATVKDVVRLEKNSEDDVEFGVSKVSVIVPVFAYSDLYEIQVPVVVKNPVKGYRYSLENEIVKLSLVPVDGRMLDGRSFTAYVDAQDIDIDETELAGKDGVTKRAVIHVRGAGGDDENSIISQVPEGVDVRITKE